MPDAPTTTQTQGQALPPLTAQNVTGRAISAILLYRLAILELAISCGIAAGSYFLGAMGDTAWSQLAPDERLKFEVGMALTILVLVKSFLSKTIANLAAGKTLPPDVSGDTQTWSRTQVRQDVLQTTAPPNPPTSQG